MTLALDLVKIPVESLSASVSFYEAALGLKAGFVSETYGWAQLDGASFALALYVPGKGGGGRTPGGTVDFHLSHDQIDTLEQQVSKSAPDATVHANADGSRSLEFSDPDGNILKIMERRNGGA